MAIQGLYRGTSNENVGGDGTLAWRLLIALAADCDEGTASAARDVDELGCVAVAESSGEMIAALGAADDRWINRG